MKPAAAKIGRHLEVLSHTQNSLKKLQIWLIDGLLVSEAAHIFDEPIKLCAGNELSLEHQHYLELLEFCLPEWLSIWPYL